MEGNNFYQRKLLEREETLRTEGSFSRLSTLILTCMDPRIDVYRIFQLKPGDVFVLRNAGNVLTEDVLRGILIAIFIYNIRNIIVLGHTDCGMKKLKTRQLREILSPGSLKYICGKGHNVGLQLIQFFKIFADEIFNIKKQMESISGFHGLPVDLNVIGMLYDVETGWVYEYEDIKDLKSFKDFHFYEEDLAKKKHEQFSDFLCNIEENIKKKPKIDAEKTEDNEKNEIKSSFSNMDINVPNVAVDNLDIKEVLIQNTNKLIKQIQNNLDQLKINMNFPEIKIPKISIPKIRVYLPKVYLKN